jgi:two-component system, cell cycle response regulator DivK
MNATAELTGRDNRSRPLLLIAEDDAALRGLYAKHLSICGFDVIEAADGADAIQNASALQPDVVIMDLSLPILDGWEATRRLKSDARTAHIPVVALTACDNSPDLQRATLAGCDWFIPKPCPPDALLTEIRRLLTGSGSQDQVKGQK